MDTPITVLLASPYTLLCKGIERLLSDEPRLSILPAVHDLADIEQSATGASIDVTVVDLALLKPSGLGALSTLLKRDPALKVLVLCRGEKEPFVSKCMTLGALGYVSLKSEPTALIDGLFAVYRRQKYLSQDVAYDFAISNLSQAPDRLTVLTAREHQVFTLLAQGKAVSEVATELFLSPKTVHVYRGNILKKLGITTAAEITLLALKHGVISLDSVD